jgi:hypothetical protein
MWALYDPQCGLIVKIQKFSPLQCALRIVLKLRKLNMRMILGIILAIFAIIVTGFPVHLPDDDV